MSHAATRNPHRDRKALRPATSDRNELLDAARFDHLWRVATLFSKSGLVPEHYRDQPENCAVAIATAVRLHLDPLMFLQRTFIAHGRPGLEAQLAIALINSRGGIKGKLRYDLVGEGDDRGCVAWAIDAESGERLESTRVTIAMAKEEGWYGKSGSRWRSMPDQMLRYRAAAFFARTHCPDALLGFYTADELDDIAQEPEKMSTKVNTQTDPSPANVPSAASKANLEDLFYMDPAALKDPLSALRDG